MNNYINVRVQAHNHTKTFNSIKHNLRAIKSLSQSNDNSNYIMLNNKLTKLTKENTTEIYSQLSAAYKIERKEHNAIYKEHNKRNLRDVKSTWCEGVFTFSEQMKEDIKNKKYSYNDLMKVANSCLEEIAQKYNTKSNYLVLHLDETTPHFHFSFSNFDEKGMSLFHSNKNKDFLSDLQNIGFEHFGKLGMERGISKELTGLNYQTTDRYWQKKNNTLKQQTISLANELNDLDIKVVDKIKVVDNYDNLLNDIKESILFDKNQLETIKSEIVDLKVERQNITKDTTKSKEDKKALYEEITTKQNDLRNLQSDIKTQIKERESLEIELTTNVNKVLENSKTIIGFNATILKEQITKLVKHYLKLNVQIKEVSDLKTQNAKLLEDNIKLTKLSNSNDKKIFDLKNENGLLTHEMKEVYDLRKNEIALSKELKEVKQTHSTQLDELNKTHSTQLDEVKQTHSTQLDEVSTQLDEANNTLTQIKTKSKNFDKYLAKKELIKDFENFEDFEDLADSGIVDTNASSKDLMNTILNKDNEHNQHDKHNEDLIDR